MSSGRSHFSAEDIEHLSGSFHNMGRELTSSNGSRYYGFMQNSAHGWEDNVEDLKEEDVWGGHEARHEDNTDWNYSYAESDAPSAYDNGGVATKSGKSRKSWLSMELQTAGLAGCKEHVGVGFAAVEAVNGGWTPGFSSRKVRIPHMGGGAGGSGYANGQHDYDVGAKRGGVPQSAPVCMPVWPLKGGYGDYVGDAEGDHCCPEDGEAEDEDKDEDSDGDDQGGRRRHPHEIVDREYARSTTFSVIEGAGRTLKGIDQRRVRNAVWSCTGFED